MKLVSTSTLLLLASLGINIFFAGHLFFKNSAMAVLTHSANDRIQQSPNHLNEECSNTNACSVQMLAGLSSNANPKNLEPEQALPETIEDSESPYIDPQEHPLDSAEGTDWIFQAIKENPNALQAIKAEHKMRVQIEYNGFFEQSALNADLRNALVDALIQRETAPYELNHQDEEQMESVHEQYQQHINNLLGPQLSQELQEYEQMMNSRWNMQDMKLLLNTNNSTFTVKKERQLAKIIADVYGHTYGNYKDSGGFGTQEQAEVDNSLPLSAIHQEILSQASHLLTADELEALDKALQHEALQSKSSDIITAIMLKQGSK